MASTPTRTSKTAAAGAAAAAAAAATAASSSVAAIPTLRVMRLQSPELYVDMSMSSLSLLESSLRTSLCLPDNLTVYVGETFTAYLGILNSSQYRPIYKLTISAQLQTPTQRYQLPCTLQQQHHRNVSSTISPSSTNDTTTATTTTASASTTKGGFGEGICSNSSPIDVPASSGVDTIVSKRIDESGQHILRIEVGYSATTTTTTTALADTSSINDTNSTTVGMKTFRKFYRFHVMHPFRTNIDHIYRTTVPNTSIPRCYVSVSADFSSNNNTDGTDNPTTTTTASSTDSNTTPTNQILITSVQFEPSSSNSGLVGQLVSTGSALAKSTTQAPLETKTRKTATQLFDSLYGSVTNYNSLSTTSTTTTMSTSSNSKYRYLFQIDVTPDDDNNNATLSIDKKISTCTGVSTNLITNKNNTTIIAGTVLGKICFTWSRAMGEIGIVYTIPIICPNLPVPRSTSTTTFIKNSSSRNNSNNNNNNKSIMDGPGAGITTSPTENGFAFDSFVVYQSGFVNDVSAALSSSSSLLSNKASSYSQFLSTNYGITIEPIDPPKTIKFGIPTNIQFNIVNHTSEPATIQLQFRRCSNFRSNRQQLLVSTAPTSTAIRGITHPNDPVVVAAGTASSSSSSLQVCGVTFQNMYNIPTSTASSSSLSVQSHTKNSNPSISPNGGSVQAIVTFIPLETTGLVQLDGCYIVDLVSGKELQQPPLFYTYVVQ